MALDRQQALDEIDVASEPKLQGIFAPVLNECERMTMQVTQGAIPDDLAGTYLRNGPNPRFTPLGSYTYPLDGDGMVHGVTFADGGARYTNRFVRTPALGVEESAGRALWPGVMTGRFPGAEEVGDELAGTERDMADIHVVGHAGRILALAEGARAFELDADLATLGPWTADGGLPNGLCAHPKVDPLTGEMVVFRYGIDSDPWLSWAVLAADGALAVPETPIEVDGPHMIHDCAITRSHLVLYVCPLRFDLGAMLSGGPLLSWEPVRGTRIAAIDRRSGEVTWWDTDPLWVWHIANAFDHERADGTTEIVVDLPTWSHPGMGLVDEPPTGAVERHRLVAGRGGLQTEVIDDAMAEFPRIDERLVGQPHRWFHIAGKDPDRSLPPGHWNALTRYDTETGSHQHRRGGPVCFGEAVFAPSSGGAEPRSGEGYLITYTYDTETLKTDLVVLDATDIGAEPVVTLAMPQRVPFGLHGSWLQQAPGASP